MGGGGDRGIQTHPGKSQVAIGFPGNTRDFPRPDLGPNIGPFPIKKLAKTSQNGVCHFQLLLFDENFMKILIKIPKLQMN